MTKPEWGTKRVCSACGTRFYDMKKKPPVCPKCEAVFEVDVSPKARRARLAAEEKALLNKPKPEDDLDDIEIDTDGDDSALIEDAEELGEDDLVAGTGLDIDAGDDDMDSR